MHLQFGLDATQHQIFDRTPAKRSGRFETAIERIWNIDGRSHWISSYYIYGYKKRRGSRRRDEGSGTGQARPHIKAGLDFQARHENEFISQKQRLDGV